MCFESSAIADHQHHFARPQASLSGDGKIEGDSAGEAESGQIELLGADDYEFQVLPVGFFAGFKSELTDGKVTRTGLPSDHKSGLGEGRPGSAQESPRLDGHRVR